MSAKPKRMVVIDGKSVFYRGYYAMPGLSTADGTPTGGVYGFAVMALEVIKRLKPDYVAVAWDKPKTNIRRRLEIYPDYKAGRKPAPADFYVQIPILHELLSAFNWPLYEADDYEADDIMATLALKASKKGIETVLISSDLDMLQCLGPHTSYYVLKKGLSNIEHYREEEFEQKYGLKVAQFVDLKSLKGDSSDNIPGVPGIGEKTAVDLLQKYHSLDGIYENLWQISGSVAKKLEAGKDLAYMSQELVKLSTNAPIPFDVVHMDMANLDVRAVEDVLRKLEFRSLIRQLPPQMNGHSAPESKGLSKLKQGALQSTSTITMHARYKDSTRQEVDYIALSDGEHMRVFEPKDIHHIGPLLASKDVVSYDTKSLTKILWQHGIELDFQKVFDVQIVAFVVNSLLRDQSISGLAREYLDIELDIEEQDEVSRTSHELSALSQLSTYFKAILEKADAQKMQSLLDSVEIPSIPVLAKMEQIGILIDRDYFKEMSLKLEGTISDLEQTIYGYADDEFNIASPQQLAVVLFEKLGLTPAGKKGKNGSYSTAADVLEKLRDDHPIIECIMHYRELTKLKGTYVDPLPILADKGGRIHTTFNLTVAQTGRLSSSDPNLQNIPVRTELGRDIRRGFIAPKGRILVSADYSQFELRLAAVLSGDSDMVEAFNNDVDVHTLTASQVFGIALEDVTKEMRYAAKAVNFGILYGQTPHGLAAGTGMSFADAKMFIDRYFAQRQPLLHYIEETKQKALTHGYVETLFGRRRPTPDVKSSNYMVREAAFRQAINMPVQGTEADLMKMAMVKLEDVLSGEPRFANLPEHEKPRQILQIHDSILIEARTDDASLVAKLMKQVMETIYPELGIKLKVDVHSGHNWGEI